MRILACLALLLGSGLVFAQQPPTNAEMAMIYELNRARNNPQRYDLENGLGGLLDGVEARPPLAVNDHLVQSARFHSAEMAANSYFAHTSPVTGDAPNRMALDAGYPLPASWPDDENYIESIAVLYTTAPNVSYTFSDSLRSLIVDAGVTPPGHRIHLLAMDSFFTTHREIGAGYAEGNAPTQSVPPPSGGGSWDSGAYWTIHTAHRDSDPVWLTGVAYDDSNGNGRYDRGEGLGGVAVSATGVPGTTTNAAGGWSIAAGAGNYTVTCSGGSFAGIATADVTMGANNIEVDFISGVPAGEVNFGGGSGNPNPPGGDDGGDTDSSGGGCSTGGGATGWLLAPVLAAWARRRRAPGQLSHA
jgi:hypothetical protein